MNWADLLMISGIFLFMYGLKEATAYFLDRRVARQIAESKERQRRALLGLREEPIDESSSNRGPEVQ